MGTLATEISLEVCGATIINLGGRLTAAEWRPWGTSYGTHMKEWTPEKGKAATALSEATEKRLMKATRAELREFVLTLRPNLFLTTSENKKSLLVTIAMNEINALRYPNEFTNEKAAA